MKGRGATGNPRNRFEPLHYTPDPEASSGPGPHTQFLHDRTRTIITTNDSPDVPFDTSVNPYRGCEHGCTYCFARPNHEYLGFSAGLDFETRILVKNDAPELLRAELSDRRWRPQPVAMSGVTDPYQPIERHLRITRRCLEVLADTCNPVAIITKSALVARDGDVLGEMARWNGAVVYLSITTLDADLGRAMEPRAATPERRLEAIRDLTAAGVPVGVLVAPVIPGLTDHELPAILTAAAEAGADTAGYIPLRLPWGVGGLFSDWLETHCPDRKEKVLHRIESIREGSLNDPRFGSRMRGAGPFAEQIRNLFELGRRQAGLETGHRTLDSGHFRAPSSAQIRLFDSPRPGGPGRQ